MVNMANNSSVLEEIINKFIKSMKEYSKFNDLGDKEVRYYLDSSQMPDPPEFPVITFVSVRAKNDSLEQQGRSCSNSSTRILSIIYLTSPAIHKDLAIRQHLRFDEMLTNFLNEYPPDDIDGRIIDWEFRSGRSIAIKKDKTKTNSDDKDEILANVTIINYTMSYMVS